jgi:hypothetical protein
MLEGSTKERTEHLNKFLFDYGLLSNKDAAIYIILDFCRNIIYVEKDLLLCDELLSIVDPSYECDEYLIAYLTITLLVTDKLKNRESFYNKVKTKLLTKHDSDYVDKLLKGLDKLPSHIW